MAYFLYMQLLSYYIHVNQRWFTHELYLLLNDAISILAKLAQVTFVQTWAIWASDLTNVATSISKARIFSNSLFSNIIPLLSQAQVRLSIKRVCESDETEYVDLPYSMWSMHYRSSNDIVVERSPTLQWFHNETNISIKLANTIATADGISCRELRSTFRIRTQYTQVTTPEERPHPSNLPIQQKQPT